MVGTRSGTSTDPPIEPTMAQILASIQNLTKDMNTKFGELHERVDTLEIREPVVHEEEGRDEEVDIQPRR